MTLNLQPSYLRLWVAGIFRCISLHQALAQTLKKRTKNWKEAVLLLRSDMTLPKYLYLLGAGRNSYHCCWSSHQGTPLPGSCASPSLLEVTGSLTDARWNMHKNSTLRAWSSVGFLLTCETRGGRTQHSPHCLQVPPSARAMAWVRIVFSSGHSVN